MAKVMTCVNGVVPEPLSVVGSAHAKGAADWGVLDEHRKLIAAVEQSHKAHAQHEQHQNCKVKDCQDPTHQHNHAADAHDHGHSHGHASKACHDVTCTEPTHAHSHGVDSDAHKHSSPGDKNHCHDHSCTDPSHAHDHSHSHSHGHAHAHDHAHASADMTTAEREFGITSFVYRRRKPFHPVRFSVFLQSLGNLSVKGVSEMSIISADTARAAGVGSTTPRLGSTTPLARARRALLRSKGFVWMGTSAQAAYFMSHAGQYLELLVLGRWWAATDKAQWPNQPDALADINVDFDGAHGDRRQEVVFIGQFAKDGGTSQRALEEVLDECLLTDEEMRQYEQVSKIGDEALRTLFAWGY
jgi:G3E family GTPase